MENSFNPLILNKKKIPELPLRLWAPLIVIGLIITTLALSAISHIEILAITQGKVIPNGEIKLINSPISAVIKDMKVKNGQQVKKGQLLLTLDLEEEQARLVAIKEKITTVNDQLNYLIPLLDINQDNLPSKLLTIPIVKDLSQIEKQVTHNRLILLSDKLADIDEYITIQNINIRQQNLLNSSKKIKLDYQEELSEINKKLRNEGFASRIEQKKIQLESKELDLDIKVGSQIVKRMEAEVNNLVSDKIQLVNNFKYEVSDSLQQLKQTKKDLINQEKYSRKRLSYQNILSPYNGFIEDVKVTTIGNFVSSGKALLKLVPIGERKIIEIMIPNSEAGFIQKGNMVRVKFDAYTYTRYGSIDGVISSLFHDANKIDGEYIYKAYVDISQDYLTIRNKTFEISHGMTAQVDVITGERSILSYFTDPILNGINQALKER